MVGKTLSKDEGEKELSLEKILEIKKAYLDLMKAYSLCLTALKLKKIEIAFSRYRFTLEWYKTFYTKHVPFPFLNPNKWSTEVLLAGNILAPRIVRWKIRGQVDLLRGAFLLLITQNRNKIDSKIIEQFELYCEDMNKLSAQFEKSGLIALFYVSIPVVLALLVEIAPISLEVRYESFYIVVVFIYLVYFVLLDLFVYKPNYK